MEHPSQDSDGVLSVERSTPRDLDVTVRLASELISAIGLIVRTRSESDANAGSAVIFAGDVSKFTRSI